MGHRNVVVRGFTALDVPKVTIDVQEIQTTNSLIVANVNVAPGPNMLDPKTHSLKEDLTISVTSAVTASNAPAERHCARCVPGAAGRGRRGRGIALR